MECLFNHLPICNHLYLGNLTTSISLFNQTFDSISKKHCLSHSKLFLLSLNMAIYNYILIKENISLHQCCHQNSLVIYNCFDAHQLAKIGHNIIQSYHFCTDYVIEKYSRPEIKKAMYYIHSNLTYKLSLEDVCTHIGLNRCYFCTLFKKETGLSFSTYLNKTRIKLATKLILETDLSLDRISEQCGFSSHSYFCNVFKHVKGMSPNQFKQSYTSA